MSEHQGSSSSAAAKPKAVLFDLDGTFADTAPDLANALNTLLQQQGLQKLDYDSIRPYVSKGAPGLIRLGFGLTSSDENYDTLRQQLLDIYAENLCQHTQLFDGISTVIEYCESNALPWGIITNKPEFLTTPLVEQLGLSNRAATVISGDTFAERKPHPMPLLEASKAINIDPCDCWYIGDDKRDIDAAKAANMTSIAALWGYFLDSDDPQNWRADHYFKTAKDLAKALTA
jgi:phosphoglycolate phosphatase